MSLSDSNSSPSSSESCSNTDRNAASRSYDKASLNDIDGYDKSVNLDIRTGIVDRISTSSNFTNRSGKFFGLLASTAAELLNRRAGKSIDGGILRRRLPARRTADSRTSLVGW